ncbi:MAG: DUF6088 family protein [Bacteroidota bacterium]|nr:DUF6088 family protein [Bacteroidota bacterium]
MPESIENKILRKIKKARGGALFFPGDFVAFGSSTAILKALWRLVDKEEIVRISRGIYCRTRISKLLNEPIMPTVDDIAQAIAKRDRARILPTGSYALNAIGLSTQVPMNVVYLTNGSARRINIGKRSILFKKTSPKNLEAIGEISRLVIQALKEIGQGNVKDEERTKIIELLKREKSDRLEYDIRIAPEWIRKIMRQALPNKSIQE